MFYFKCGKFWYNKHWSHTELEFRDVYNKMQQAKMGYPGFSDTHDLMRCQDSTAYFFGAGSTAGKCKKLFWRAVKGGTQTVCLLCVLF